MARAVRLDTLRDRIIARGDIDTNRHPAATLTEWINEARLQLLDAILEVNDTWDVDSATGAIVSGSDTVGLPADCYVLLRVDILQSTGKWEVAGRFNQMDQDLQDSTSSRSGVRLAIRSSDVLFQVTPGWSEAAGIRFWYVPVPADLSADSDTFDGVFGWEEYVTLAVLLMVKEMDEEDITGTAALLGAQTKRIQRRAKRRDLGNPPTIRDVSGGGVRSRRIRSLPRP